MYSNLSETVQDYMCAEACTDAVCWISLGDVTVGNFLSAWQISTQRTS